MAQQPRRIGRPAKPPTPGTRVSLGLKVTGEIKQRLDAAAQKSGRTQSQEAEARLEQTFRDEQLLPQLLDGACGPEAAGLLMLLGQVIRRTETRIGPLLEGPDNPAPHWTAHAWAFRQVADAVDQIFQMLAPAGPIEEPAVLQPGAWTAGQIDYMREIGRHTAMWAIHAALHPGANGDLAPFTRAITDRLGKALCSLEKRQKQLVAELERPPDSGVVASPRPSDAEDQNNAG